MAWNREKKLGERKVGMEEYRKKYEEWKQNPFFDEETKKELKSIEGNEEEIKDRFYKDLSFGTAGLRGIL